MMIRQFVRRFIAPTILDGIGRPEVNNVVDQGGARRGEPNTAVAGRPGRALADCKRRSKNPSLKRPVSPVAPE